MNKLFIFQHGWGFDKNFWQNIMPYFKDEQCIFLDRGYFGNSSPLEDLPNNHLYIGIGHSLGFVKLLNNISNIKFDYLIGLNSFINFLGSEPKLQSLRKKEIALIKQGIKHNCLKTLEDFYQRCSLKFDDKNYNEINNDLLVRDLDMLLTNYSLPNQTHTLIVNSKNDKIIPETIFLDNFNQYKDKQATIYLETLENGKHGLGYLHAKLIYNKIINFVNVTI